MLELSSSAVVIPLYGRDKYTVKISHTKTKRDQFFTVYATDVQDALSRAMVKHTKSLSGLGVAEQMTNLSLRGFYVYEPVKMESTKGVRSVRAK